jgi:hypothetical protein
MTKVGQDLLTDHGLNLPDNMTESQFFEVGKVLGNIERGSQWAIGDWYNAIPLGSKWDTDDGKKAACERVGLNYNTARSYADVCRSFSIDTRVSIDGITFNHHRMLAVDTKLTAAQRQSLLRKAAKGEKDGKGKWRPWSSKRLVQERDKLLGTYEEPVKVESGDAIADFTEQALPNLPGKYQKQVARAIRAAADKLSEDFEVQVKKHVDERMKAERERIKKREQEAKAEMDKAIKLKAGVKGFMTEQEFKLIRSLLHPDKHGGDKRYAKAFDIFNRLAGA